MRSVAGQQRWGGGKLRRAMSAAVAMLLATSAFTIAAVPASADPGPSIDSSPTNATTATLLEWAFSNATPASCELTEGATDIAALADCVSPADFDVSADAGGSYTFTVYAAAAADVVVGTTPSATSTVDVAPVAPTITHSPNSPDNDPTPTWSFTLPTDASATCELDDPSSDAVETVTDCTSPFTVSDLNSAPANGANGQYTFSVTPTSGGVTGDPATSSYSFDTVQPAAPAVSADASTGFSLHPTFAVSGLVSGATLTCSVTSPGSGPAVSVQSCGASSALDLTGGIDGSYTLHVTQTKAGNVSDDGTASYLLDTHTPATPTVSPPTSPGLDASPTFAISDIEAGATLECSVTGPSTIPVTTCGSSTTLDFSAASDGVYTLTVTARDAAGKDSAPATGTYEFEAGGPSAPVVTAPSSPSKSRVPSFGVTDSDPVDLTYSCTVTGPSTVTTSQCGLTSTLALAGAADGTYELSVVATDGLDQASPAGTATFTLDTTPPPAPTVTPPSSPSSDTSPSFAIDESDAGTTLACSVSGPSSFPIPPADCASGVTLDLSGANRDGVYTLTVTATDAAGNVSPGGSATFTLDTTPPPVPTIVAPTSPSKDLTPTFTVADTETGVTLTCVFLDPNDAVVFSGTCPSNGTFDTSTDSVDGQYRLVVTAADAAGNESSAPATWTRDTTAPPPPTVGAPLSPSNEIGPSFAISDSESGVSFGCVLTGPGGAGVFAGACPIDGIFDLAGFGDGSYSLSVTATDLAGNTSPPGIASYVLDTTPPPPPSVALLAPLLSTSNVTAPQFSVSDTEPGVSYICSVSGVTSVLASAITCGATTTVDLSGVGRDGNYTLSVSAVDVAGNVSAPSTITYTLDTTAPPNPTVVAPASPSKDLTPTFTISDSEADAVLSCVLTGPGNVIAFSNLCPANGTFNVTGFGDGTYVLSVTATDPAGNAAPATGTATYVLDTTPPPVPVVTLSSPATSPGNLTAPQFSVSDTEPGVSYFCTASGVTTVPSSAIACGATTTVDLSGLGRDGNYTLSVTATDAAGNTSAATPASYTLDTTAPAPPIVGLASATRSSSKTPLWTWQFDFNDQATGLDIATCTVTGPNSWSSTTVNCPHHFATALGGGDGAYTMTVTLTDEAGNASSAVSPVYTLDNTAPAGPTVFLLHPIGGAGLDRHPVWRVTGPANTTLMCTLHQGGKTGAVVSPESVCPNPATYSLAGMPDGLYTLEVVTVDAAQNVSTAATSSYVLVPSAPRVVAPHNESATAVWAIHGNPSDSFICTLTSNNHEVSAAHACGTHPTFDMSRLPPAVYTLFVVQVGAEGVRSGPGSASWLWAGPPPPPPGPPGSKPQHHHPVTTKPPAKPNPLASLPGVVRKQLQKLSHEVSTVPLLFPIVHPNRVTDAVVTAVQGVAHAVGTAGGGTGFPLLLLGLVLMFLLVQNRIDRRDPKLALASIAADDTVEFQPPPSRRDRP